MPLLFLISCASVSQNEYNRLRNKLDSMHVKTVHLSFDDGPSPVYTPEILAYLKQENIKANFFLVGKMVKLHPELVEQEVAEGHDIGGHSMTHKELTKIPLDDARREILESMELVNKFQKTDLFRFPYGSFDVQLLVLARAQGYRNIYWDVDTTDWKYPDQDVIYKKFKLRIARSGDNAIILMHDIHPQTLPALKMIVRYLKERHIVITKIK